MKKQYNKDGFYIAKGLLSDKEIDRAVDSFKTVFTLQLNNDAKYKKNSTIFDIMKSLYDLDINKYKSSLGVLSKLASIYSLVQSKSIQDKLNEINIKERVIPTGPVVHVVSSSLVIPGGYFGQVAHQDWTSMQGSLDAVIVWIPLHTIEKNYYNLEVIPRSHMSGFLDGKVTDNQHIIDPSLYNDEDFVQVEVNKGDVVFMSSWTVHRTSLQGPQCDVRLACSVRYENLAEKTFVERGYPSAYKRSVSREFITPNFPSTKQVKEIFK